MSSNFILFDKFSSKLKQNDKRELISISKQIDYVNKIKIRNVNRLKNIPNDLLEQYGINKYLEILYLKRLLEEEIKDFYQPDENIINEEGLEFKYSIEIMNNELYVIIEFNKKIYMSNKIRTFIDFLNFIRDIKKENKRFHYVSLFKNII